jgi:hypothetical protein
MRAGEGLANPGPRTAAAHGPQIAPEFPDRYIARARKIDRSNAEARRAVAEVASRFGTWRTALAQMAARADRLADAEERRKLLEQCDGIGEAILGARTDLILELAEAPQKVAGHSRVVDMERAFDNLDTSLEAVRNALRRAAV